MLTSTKMCYSNIDREALGILYGLDKVHSYCFAHEVSVIADPKPLLAIFRKDVDTSHEASYYVYVNTT